jgi:hypothetical protein
LPRLLDFRGELEPELLKADFDSLPHPTLSRLCWRGFSPDARRFGAPAATIAGVLGIERAPEPLQFQDQGCALRSPFLGPRAVTPARRVVELFGVI